MFVFLLKARQFFALQANGQVNRIKWQKLSDMDVAFDSTASHESDAVFELDNHVADDLGLLFRFRRITHF
jgi:hypothetical protein